MCVHVLSKLSEKHFSNWENSREFSLKSDKMLVLEVKCWNAVEESKHLVDGKKLLIIVVSFALTKIHFPLTPFWFSSFFAQNQEEF